MMIRSLVVDDEQLARRSILRFLANDREVEILAECADGESAISEIVGCKPDLVFLDIQMPEIDGFEVVKRVGADSMPATIFVTAYEHYAVRAFEANALDYLLKPFRRERFERALTRAKRRIAERSDGDAARRLLSLLEASTTHQPGFADRLPVSENERIVFIKTTEIDWIEAKGNYVRLHVGARSYEIRESLTGLERKLNPEHFLRVHRSTIINSRRIKEIQPWFHGHHVIVLDNGEKLRMSRYQTAAAQRLGLRSGL
jgi:two-component system, LytTR family, response regulator